MAFALTSFFADGTRFSGPGPYRATQSAVLTITGLTTDVALDIGTPAGTFWTDAKANATYGTLATQVLAALTTLAGQVTAVKSVYTPEISNRIQAAAASGTAYTFSIDSTSQLPIYTFAASNGATAYTVFIEWLPKVNILPTNLAFNVAV